MVWRWLHLLMCCASAAEVQLAPTSFAARCQRALRQHAEKPYPPVSPDDLWGEANAALAQLALDGPTNKSLAAEISAK